MPQKKGGDLRTIKRKIRNTAKDVGKLVNLVSSQRLRNTPTLSAITQGEPVSLKRKVDVYPPQVREQLSKIGTEPISSLTVVRAPIQSAVHKLLDVISLGTYDKAVRESGYDKMFHLALLINGKYIFDKQEVVKLTNGSPASDAETMSVPVNTPCETRSDCKELTVQQLVDNKKQHMGAKAISSYSASSNNCQRFLIAILEANGLLTDDLRSFISQDAKSVFDRMPSFTERLGKVITDVGATVDRIVEGEGEPKPKKGRRKAKTLILDLSKLSWNQYVSHHCTDKKFSSQAEVHANLKKLGIEFKALKTVK